MSLDHLLVLFKALASKNRLALVRVLILMDGPRTNQDVAIAAEIDVRQASDELKYLYEAGVVSRQKSGRHVYYTIESEPLARMTEFLDNGDVK